MMPQDNNIANAQKTDKHTPARPDDQGNIELAAYVRVFDPNTQETLVEARS